MARCDQMHDTYQIANAGIYNGPVTTRSQLTANFYNYRNGQADWHFTPGNTNGGQQQQRQMANMHFTIELSVGGGIANGHIFFNAAGTITGNNDNELSAAARQAFVTYRTAHAQDIQGAITSMAGQLV